MSAPEQQTPEQQAAADATAAAADAGATPAQAQEQATAAAAAANPSLTAADHEAIAKATVKEFERIGAFENTPPPAAAAPAGAAPPPPAGEGTPGPETIENPPTGQAQPPRKKTLAERFVKRA